MGKHFTEYIDLTSFANQWMIYELNMEISVNSSVYFYKDTDAHGDGKLHASWPWDMEHSIHVAEYAQQSWFATADTNPAGLLDLAVSITRSLEKQYRTNGRKCLFRHWIKYLQSRKQKIRTIYTKRKEFLSRALPGYQLPYAYYYQKVGILYGVTYDGNTDEVRAGTAAMMKK